MTRLPAPLLSAILPLFAGALLCTPLAAQDAPDEGDPCASQNACRVIGPLRVEAPDGAVSTVEMGMTLPWVVQGNVLLAPGDAVLVALDEVGGVLSPRLISTGEAARSAEVAEGQVRFDFGLIMRGDVLLSVQSGMAIPVEYAALKVSLADGPNRTSTCTLMPGLTVFESWSEPVYQLALWAFRPAQGMACTEIDLGTPLQLERSSGR